MKTVTFFIPLLLLGLFVVIHRVVAQTTTDSIAYYKQLAINPHQSQDIIDAYWFFENSKENNLQQQQFAAAVHDLRVLAIIHYDLGMYYESESAITQAIELIENKNLGDSLQAGCYNQLGKIYRQLNNADWAIKYYNRALSYTTKARDSFIILNNIGNIYKEQNQWQQAETYLQRAYSISRQLQDSTELARVLDNLSFVHYKLGDIQALTSMLEALEIRKKYNDHKGIYASYKNLASYYLEQNQLQQAAFYADQAFQTAQLVNSPAYLKNALGFFSQLSNDPYFSHYKKITDSLEISYLQQQNKFAAIKYDFNKEQLKTYQAQLQQQKEKSRKQLFQLLFALLSIVASLIIYLLVANYRRNTRKKIEQTENRISIKIHDEVANDLFRVMNKIQHQASPTEVLDDIEHIYDKTRDISKEISAIDVEIDFESRLNDLLLTYKNEKVNVITRNKHTIPWNKVSSFKKIALYRVLQELMTNMKKHSQASLVVILFSIEKNKIFIKYTDNGIGNEIFTKNGLQNAETRIESVGGQFNFESSKGRGFKAEIIL
jgi:signal transduction histidine kinase